MKSNLGKFDTRTTQNYSSGISFSQTSEPSRPSTQKKNAFDTLFEIANETAKAKLGASAPKFTLPTTGSGIVKKASTVTPTKTATEQLRRYNAQTMNYFDVPVNQQSNDTPFDIDPSSIWNAQETAKKESELRRAAWKEEDRKPVLFFGAIGQTANAAPGVITETVKEAVSTMASKEYSDALSKLREAERVLEEARTAATEETRSRFPDATNLDFYASGDPAYEEAKRAVEEAQAALDAIKAKSVVDTNSPAMQAYAEARDTADRFLEGLSPEERFLGQTALSIGQNLAVLPSALINPAAPLFLMGASAAADKSYDLNTQGVPATESLVRGIVSGGIEAATEKLPLDNVLSAIKGGTGRTFIKNILRQAGLEATEEGISYALNYAADKASHDPNAAFSVQELIQNAAAGGLSGLFFGSGTSIIGASVNAANNRMNANVQTGIELPTAFQMRSNTNSQALGNLNAQNTLRQLANQMAAERVQQAEAAASVPAATIRQNTQAAPSTASPAARMQSIMGTLGENGKAAFSNAAQQTGSVEEAYPEFSKAYSDGYTGKTEAPNQTPEAQAAYYAGQNDAQAERAVDTDRSGLYDEIKNGTGGLLNGREGSNPGRNGPLSSEFQGLETVREELPGRIDSGRTGAVGEITSKRSGRVYRFEPVSQEAYSPREASIVRRAEEDGVSVQFSADNKLSVSNGKEGAETRPFSGVYLGNGQIVLARDGRSYYHEVFHYIEDVSSDAASRFSEVAQAQTNMGDPDVMRFLTEKHITEDNIQSEIGAIAFNSLREGTFDEDFDGFFSNPDAVKSAYERLSLEIAAKKSKGTSGFDMAQSNVDQMKSIKGEDSRKKWTASRVGDTKKKPQTLSDLVGKIQHDFGINITTGHIRGSRTLGQYNRADRGIRSKIANDLPTISHELGHHFDNAYKITTGNLDESLKNELIGNMDEELLSLYPKKEHASEGMAEYLRRFLQNRETASIDYPKFTEYFFKTLKNTDGAILENLADEVNAYYSMDADSAASAIRLSAEGGKDFRTTKEKIKDSTDAFYQAWVDSNHGIKRFAREAGDMSVYRLASNSAYSDAVAGQILYGDLTSRDGQYVAPGLKTALSGINTKNKTEYRAFGEYLVVKHGPERLKEGMRVFADDRKNSSNFMEARQLELEEQYPEFKEASERVYAFERAFLQTWGVDTGLVSPESKQAWEQRWGFYVPFNRAMEKGGRTGARRGFANQSSGIRKAIGSGLDIVHPVDNIVYNVVRMVNAGTRNAVMTEIVNAAEKTGGMAGFLERVPDPLKRVSVRTESMKNNLKNSVSESDMSDADKDIAFDIIGNLDDILYQYQRGRAKGDVISVLKDGETQYWKINDKMLLESITSLTPSKTPAWLEAYGSVSRFMTGNITGNNIIWSVFSNAPRDIATMFTYSKNKNPAKILVGIASSYANNFKGQNADPLYKEYLAMGGGKSSAYTADRSLAKRTISQFSKSKLNYINPMEWVSFISDAVEMGPRFATYKIMRQKGMSPQDAFYESSDITVNFRRGGTNARSLNKVIPFFNASVQGIDKFSRWIRAADVEPPVRKKAIVGRTASYVAASATLAVLIYAINNRDEKSKEDYQQLSTYTKNSYWCFPIGDGKFFAVPKPRELAVLSSFTETALEYFYGGNRHAFDGFYDYATENLLPSVLSDVAKLDAYGAIGNLGIIGTGAYMMANRDFMGRPIVSGGLQSLEPKDQYNERTSKVAKAIGDAFNQSPQMIDYFLNQTMGGWWKVVKSLLPVGEGEIDPTLGVFNTYIKDNQYSTDLINWLYDKSSESEKVKNSNPDDIEKALDYKWDSSMSTFYSRYYAAAKNESETERSRFLRQTVLTMIADYRSSVDNGYKTEEQKAVEKVCKAAGSTEFLPSVMQNTVKDANKKTHTLSGNQYYEFQTDYLRLYWEAVEDALPDAKTQKEKEQVLKSARDFAAEQAKLRALKRIGAPYEQEDLYTGSVDIGDYIYFNATYSMLESDKDKDGNSISGSKREKVIQALEEMNLTDKERSYLFESKGYSTKNNPWS